MKRENTRTGKHTIRKTRDPWRGIHNTISTVHVIQCMFVSFATSACSVGKLGIGRKGYLMLFGNVSYESIVMNNTL